MPVYEYICSKCSEKFSLLRSISSRESGAECPKCASKSVKKIMSSFSCSPCSDTNFSSPVPSGNFTGRG